MAPGLVDGEGQYKVVEVVVVVVLRGSVDGKDPPVRLSSLLCLKTRYIFVGEYKDCAAPPEKMIKFGYSLVLERKLRSLSYQMRLYLKFWLI